MTPETRFRSVLTLGLAAGLFVLSAGLTGGCGRVFPGGDGGVLPDGGPLPDGIISPDGAIDCTRLDPNVCERYPGCELLAGCGTCNGPAPVSCVPQGTESGPCPDIACLDCGSITDEATCKGNPQCQVISCPGCNGQDQFALCYDANSPPPPIGCPAIACVSCDGLDEMTCGQTPGCSPLYGCPDCQGNQTYSGCYDSSMPPPPVACPAIACVDCTSLDQNTCGQYPECQLTECMGCNGQVIEICGNAGQPASCPAFDCPVDQCTGLDEQTCFNSDVCHPVYQTQNACGCVAPGCCTFFDHCAQNKYADCTGSGGVVCNLAPPDCQGPYTVGYLNGCYEGCVLTQSCPPPPPNP
jgi:hypothetical protein